MRLLIIALLSLISVSDARAALELPSLFTDSMVLQRDQPVRIWGWAEPGARVTVTMGTQKPTATTEPNGRWSLTLDPFPAGGPHTMSISDGATSVTLKDILVGEVWLCSGQSNMAMTVSRAAHADTEAAAADYPQIRMFRVSSGHSTEPQDRCQGNWTVCSPSTVGGFSATAYFFGRRLHQELGVPVGLINSSVGGTSIESWTSMPAQSAVAAIAPRLDAWKASDADYDETLAASNYEKALGSWQKRAAAAKASGKPAPRKPQLAVRPRQDRNYPSNLFNGKINALVGYTLKGAVWYQGENSSGRGFAHLYGQQLQTLIADWRTRWGQGDFPFAWVQLPNFKAPQTQPAETSGWVLVQEGMLKTLSVPHTGMAITIDVGEEKDIHPKDKQTVGQRLAQWALATVYDKDLIPMGPIYRSAAIDGSKVVIEFDYAEGLHAADDKVKGFAIAGADRVFAHANARIDGHKVIVSSDQVSQPVSVRYAWAANPVFSLYNAADIPASPFRTDDWPEKAE